MTTRSAQVAETLARLDESLPGRCQSDKIYGCGEYERYESDAQQSVIETIPSRQQSAHCAHIIVAKTLKLRFLLTLRFLDFMELQHVFTQAQRGKRQATACPNFSEGSRKLKPERNHQGRSHCLNVFRFDRYPTLLERFGRFPCSHDKLQTAGTC